MKKIIILFCLALITSFSYSQNIPRRAIFGIKLIAINDSITKSLNLTNSNGLIITGISKNSTGENLKLQLNDIILKVNNTDILYLNDYKDAVKNIKGNDKINFLIKRNNENINIEGVATPMPFESSEKFDVIYDEVKFKDGYLRVIVNKPKENKKYKTILFIPGYMCYSLDNIGKHPYGQVVEKLTEKGYAVIRVEKSGMGDCFNTPDCFDIDYSTELEGFQKGFEKISQYDFVDKNNIFVFGHSLGGYEAPMVDKNGIAKGVIVCGTGLKTWYEYILDMFRFQNPIMGIDFIENEKIVTEMTKILYDILILKKNPLEISESRETKNLMKEWLELENNGRIWSRNYTFWQQLQDLNMPEVWKNVKSNVLVIRGEGDFEAFSTDEHKEIVKIVNHYNPDANPEKAKFILIPNMDHGFATAKTPEESYKKKSEPGFYYNNFNDAIIDEISKWIESL